MPRTPALFAALFFCAGARVFAAEPKSAGEAVEAATRQAGAYDAWKLALKAERATDPQNITAPPGFRVELLRSALPEEDSWVSMAFDREGRITIGCEKKGLLRLTLEHGAVTKVERINDTLLECRGLLYAYGALYAMANNSKTLVRLRSTHGDGHFDEIKELLKTDGGVGHGRNHVKLGPDGMLYLAHGNNVVAPPNALTPASLRNMRDDRVIPCPWDPQMFDGDVTLPAGHILRTDPNGESWELIAGGFRNELDLAWDQFGELFTFDADMEWDTGTPWYRPTRVNHVLPGADYGWRRGTSKWPDYFPDCGPTAVNIGLASPTAVIYSRANSYDSAYWQKLYICDWAYGRIMAVELKPNGASYSATATPFISGKPLNVTDAAFSRLPFVPSNEPPKVVRWNHDGELYFITGGRRTQSGLYRVVQETYGDGSFYQRGEGSEMAQRRHLESLRHGGPATALTEIWPALGHPDAGMRHAARVALEAQPVEHWRERAVAERNTLAQLTALMALAHTGSHEDLEPMLASLETARPNNREERILHLRDYQLALARLGQLDEAQAARSAQRLNPLYPNPQGEWECDHLLCELLVYLGVPDVVEKSLALLAKAERSEDFLQYLFHLRDVPHEWRLDQRRAYFTALNHADTLEGARDYQRSLRLIRSEVAEILTAEERRVLGPLIEGNLTNVALKNTGPQLQVKDWKLEDIEPRLDRIGKGRAYESGRLAFTAAQCIVCHRLGKTGGLIGPDLTGVSSRFSRRDLLLNILEPSKVIDDKYRSTSFRMKSGSTVVGMVDHEDDEAVYVRVNPASPETTGLPKTLIVSREASPISPMPTGLLNVLSETQILDLLAYLEAVGDPHHADFQK